jgi:hypothetical protein
MRYALLIASPEAANGGPTPESEASILPEYAKFGEEMTKRGVLRVTARR